MIVWNKHSKVILKKYSISKGSQQIGISFKIPPGAKKILGMLAYCEPGVLLKDALYSTSWPETLGGKMWLKWNHPPAYFHFQSVDLLHEFEQDHLPLGISEPVGFSNREFALLGKRLVPLSLKLPSGTPYINGFYQDSILAKAGFNEGYLLYLNLYYSI